MLLESIDNLIYEMKINKKHMLYGTGGALVAHGLATHGLLGKGIENSYDDLRSNISGGLSAADSGWHASQAAYDIRTPNGSYLDRVSVGVQGAFKGYDVASHTKKISDFVPSTVTNLYDSASKVIGR